MPRDACSFAGLEKGFHPREFTAESGPDRSLVPAGALPVLEGPGVRAVLPTWVWEGGENRATLLLLTPSPWRAVAVAVATPVSGALGNRATSRSLSCPTCWAHEGAVLGPAGWGGRGRLRESRAGGQDLGRLRPAWPRLHLRLRARPRPVSSRGRGRVCPAGRVPPALQPSVGPPGGGAFRCHILSRRPRRPSGSSSGTGWKAPVHKPLNPGAGESRLSRPASSLRPP